MSPMNAPTGRLRLLLLPSAGVGTAPKSFIASTAVRYCPGRHLHTKKPQCHVIRSVPKHITTPRKRNACVSQQDHLHRFEELLQSGFRYPNLGAPLTWLQGKLWLLIRPRIARFKYGVVESRNYLRSEELIRKAYPNPTSKEKDAIDVARTTLMTAASTKIAVACETDGKFEPTIRDIHAIEDANYALRHFTATYKDASPYSVLRGGENSYGVHLLRAQGYIVQGEKFVSILRKIAPKQLELLEQAKNAVLARFVMQRYAFPNAREQLRYRELLETSHASETLTDQLLAEFAAIGATHVRGGEVIAQGMREGKGLFVKVSYLPSRAIPLYTVLEQSYAKSMRSVNDLPASSSKNKLLDALEKKRAYYEHETGEAHKLQHCMTLLQARRNKKK